MTDVEEVARMFDHNEDHANTSLAEFKTICRVIFLAAMARDVEDVEVANNAMEVLQSLHFEGRSLQHYMQLEDCTAIHNRRQLSDWCRRLSTPSAILINLLLTCSHGVVMCRFNPGEDLKHYKARMAQKDHLHLINLLMHLRWRFFFCRVYDGEEKVSNYPAVKVTDC